MIDPHYGHGMFIDRENNSMRSVDEVPNFLFKVFLFWNDRTPSRQHFKGENPIDQAIPPLFSDEGLSSIGSYKVDIRLSVGQRR